MWLWALLLGVGCVTPKTPLDTGRDTDVPEWEDSGGGCFDAADADGWCFWEGDCDDSNSEVHPGAEELCDGIDNDCDETIDEGVEATYYFDADGDGFGDPGDSQVACEAPDGYVQNDDDCDDARIGVFPGNPELCDNADNDCNGEIDDGVGVVSWLDGDGDTYGDPATLFVACGEAESVVGNGDDCDDTNAQVHPGGVEVCDGADNDCSGAVDDGVCG